MRRLLPDPAPDIDLHEFYASDWLELPPGRACVRSDFVSSVDGAATAHGKSEGLQTAGDNAVFHALRDLADVVLVGARTAAIEQYAPVSLSADRVAFRQRYGLSPELPTAVLSRTLTVDTSAPLYSAPQGTPRTIVITCAAVDDATRERVAEHCDVVTLGTDSPDLPAAIAALAERGLPRVLFEGGPSLHGAMLAAGAVDELCLSLTPKLIGPGAPRIVDGAAWSTPLPDARLTGLLEDDGSLFARYRLR